MDDPPGPFVDDVATTPTSNTSRDGGNAGGRPGDMVFAIARGVATVVTIAAMTLVLVLLIIAQSVLMVVAERLGLAPIVVLLVTVVLALSHKMQVPLKALARVLIF